MDGASHKAVSVLRGHPGVFEVHLLFAGDGFGVERGPFASLPQCEGGRVLCLGKDGGKPIVTGIQTPGSHRCARRELDLGDETSRGSIDEAAFRGRSGSSGKRPVRRVYDRFRRRSAASPSDIEIK
jgi:hypothetical protein